ncbi:M48 family metallopeptidase [Helicobacter pylori]|uniref:M48 family metallopeptidase n=2 Tax=Helicobacter pylori TaxID=210 RepID=UPI000C319BF3|nr:M48 family metallopeptidase [Helicobacter pylori]
MLDIWIDMIICIFYLLFFTTPYIIGDILQLKFIRQKLCEKPVLLPQKDYEEAGNYAIRKMQLSIISQILDGIIFAGWVFFGLTHLEDLTHYLNLPETLGYLVFALLFLAIQSVLALPIKLLTTMHLDKEFGFSKVSLSLFFKDFFKGLSLTLSVGLLLIYTLIMIIEHVEHWEISSFFVVFVFMILANLFYPKIAQLFNQFTPLNNRDLESQIEGMMDKVGFKSQGIFVMDASKRDGRLNAYFGGLGKNKRVVLFDTLISKVGTDGRLNAYFGGLGKNKRVVLFDTLISKVGTEGLLAILGHELGHFKNKDLLKSLGIMGGLLALVFALIAHLPPLVFEGFNVSQTPASLIAILLLFLPVFSFYAMPLIGFFSRKNEYNADKFGASLSSKEVLAKALVSIVSENKAFPYSHPFYVFLHFTHPPLLERLKALDYEIE